MAMAGLLLLPWVEGLVGKAADALVQKVTCMWHVENYRSKLESQLVYVHLLLADAEEKAKVKTEAGRAVKAWMKKLKAATYKADDVLDDFQYEALRCDAQSGESTSRKVLYFSRDRLVFHHKASWDLKNVLDKIDELVAEMNAFDLLERAEAPQVLYQQTHSALDESLDVFGRDDDKEVVVKLLLDQQHQWNVQVLPIIGMGGLGKTTLAKMVYKDHKIHNHFDLLMWHCVSENFEATAVVRSVIELATGGRCGLPENIELLRGKLQEAIGRKRFLLVLEDVWNEDERKWVDGLKPLLCSSNGGSGSMILVTSRSRQVAAIMGTIPPHELTCLSEDDSWKLFTKKAFGKGVQEQPELVIIGKRIVNRCKGLPLALKSMGGLLSSKPRVQQWDDISKSSLGNATDEVLPILKLSYRHLSPEMKQCFAFCAIFPKDYEMEKDKLIELWIANGFIVEEGIMDLEQKGEFVFNELAWRSFLQDVNVKSFYCPNFRYQAIGCKMHDLMHDLAKDTSGECANTMDLIQKRGLLEDVHHMLISSDELEEISGLLKGTTSFRTLLTESSLGRKEAKSEHQNLNYLELMSLRALCCMDPSFVHNQLGNTRHLRYLDLSGSDIVGLPDSVCVLYNLLSLRLIGCRRLRYLPESMMFLRKLRHLYLLECDNLERMPPKLGLLQNLCTLTTYVVDTRDGCGIEELEYLQQLGERLELYNLRKVKCGSKANLHKKQNLNELVLCWGRNYKEYEAGNKEQVLESLVPHDKLKILEVHGYGGLTISQWMRNPIMFQCLRELIMTNCRGCKDIPTVWLSSSLEHLSLRHMERLTTLCKNVDMETEAYRTSLQIFPKLKRMELMHLPELERWADNSAGEINRLVAFPQLEKLVIENCDKLSSLPDIPALTVLNLSHKENNSTGSVVSMHMPLGCLSSLVSLEILGMLVDVMMPPDVQQSQSQGPLDTLRHLRLQGDNSFVSIFNRSKLQLGLRDCLAFVEELDISSCSNIVHWPVEELRCFPRLRSLHIGSCSKLEGNGSSSEAEEILPLPQLETLGIDVCNNLLQIPKLPQSLVEIKIIISNSLVALPSNLGDLFKLRTLSVWGCGALKVLPDGMDGLTSLEQLAIGCCGVEKFLQGLLQRLPALKRLDMQCCPDLQRRCREGGEYFDLVASIPKKFIPPLS